MNIASKVTFPKWVVACYLLLTVVLVPWIFNLAQTLPARHVVKHWDVVWVGFDGLILLTLLATIYFVIKSKIWVVISASILATLFLVDVWFDIMTAHSGRELHQALFFGCLEIGLSLFTFQLVITVIKRVFRDNKLSFTAEDSTKSS